MGQHFELNGFGKYMVLVTFVEIYIHIHILRQNLSSLCVKLCIKVRSLNFIFSKWRTTEGFKIGFVVKKDPEGPVMKLLLKLT